MNESVTQIVRLCRYSPYTDRWTPVRMGLDSLSMRELQIVKLCGSGLLLADIARELFISWKTVSTYRIRAIEKLGIANDRRVSGRLIQFCLAHGLVENPFKQSSEEAAAISPPDQHALKIA